MPKIFKQDKLEFKTELNAVGRFNLLTAFPRLSTIVESKHMVFDYRTLKQDEYSFPYHFHRNAEELVFIISGSMIMRTPQGLENLKTGDLIFFEIGESGAHQFYNEESESCTYLDIRTTIGLDVCEYPDSGKLNIVPYNEIYETSTKVDYLKGEDKIDDIWRDIRTKEK